MPAISCVARSGQCAFSKAFESKDGQALRLAVLIRVNRFFRTTACRVYPLQPGFRGSPRIPCSRTCLDAG